MPRNVYSDLFEFGREFEGMFNRLMGTWPRVAEPKALAAGFVPTAEAWTDQEKREYYLRVALPGVEPKEVNVEVQGNVLSITGERKATETKKETNFLQREFSYGSFERVMTLPEGVEVEKITAEFNNGVLEITAPIATAALSHRVEIKPALKKAA